MLNDPRSLSRREAIGLAARGTAALAAAVAYPTIGAARPAGYPLGYGLYGMRSIPHLEALGHVARIGYPTVELCLRPGWDTEPRLLTRGDRAEIRRRIDDLGLELVSVMEGMRPVSPDATLESNLERLRAAAEMAHECSPGEPALIQSPLGGPVGAFDERREAMAEELSAWARLLEELDVTFCIKPHSTQSMSLPEHAVWLVEQVNSPRLKAVYDYSHFAARSLDMEATIRQLAPHMGFVHIKDTVGTAPGHRFVLPGDGGVDYGEYLRIMADVGYRGPIVTEVSVHVFGEPDYDPVATAQYMWDNLSPIFAG